MVITAGDAAQRYWWLLLLGLLAGVWLIAGSFGMPEVALGSTAGCYACRSSAAC